MKQTSLHHECGLAWRFILATALIAAALAVDAGAGEMIDDKERGFKLKVPDGFVASPQLAEMNPKCTHAFVLQDLTDTQRNIVLFVETLGGTIGNERLRAEDIPAGSPARLSKARWKWQGFDIDVIEIPEGDGNQVLRTLTYNAQIPLKKQALQLKLLGAADREADLTRLLAELLGSLQGESNLQPVGLPSAKGGLVVEPLKSRLGDTIRPGERSNLILFMGIALVVGGVAALYGISKVAPKGTVLAIALALYAVSYAIPKSEYREVELITGVTRMLGFAGGILGLIDVVRQRKPTKKPAET